MKFIYHIYFIAPIQWKNWVIFTRRAVNKTRLCYPIWEYAKLQSENCNSAIAKVQS